MALLLAPFLYAAGFTSTGVASGSSAAGIQASLGNVVGGSCFATAQSMGATTATATLVASGVIWGVLASGALGLLYYRGDITVPKAGCLFNTVGRLNMQGYSMSSWW